MAGGLAEGARCDRVCNLIDAGATMIEAAGASALPRSRARSLLGIARDPASAWADETYSEYVTDLSSPWTGTEATTQRMVRAGRWKYVHVEGYRPILFDLAADPDELSDLGDSDAHVAIRESLSEKVLDGWDARAIRREVDLQTKEKAILRDWGGPDEAPKHRAVPDFGRG